MKVTSSEYVKSLLSIRDFDLPVLPAVAFIGRSNVGKSSLINHLLNRKKLVKTSSTPGKTQLLNYFLINRSFYFVDLPGYGFANVPVKVKNSWQKMIHDFIHFCPDLKLIIQLVDIRHKPGSGDIAFQEILEKNSLPYLVVANKTDKIKKNQVARAIKEIKNSLNLHQAPKLHSALKKTGKEEIWHTIVKYLSESKDPIR